MTFSTPHGRARYRLPWSWTAFDYETLCELLWAQCGDARFETADGRRPHGRTRSTPIAATSTAPLLVDAAGWRRVLTEPARPAARGDAEPRPGGPSALPGRRHATRRLGRALAHPPRLRLARAGRRRARASACGSYDPHQHVKEPTDALAAPASRSPTVRYQGNWFPHALRAATDGDVLCVGDSAGHCFPLSGEGIRTAFYFGIAAGRELRAVLDGGQTREQAPRRLRRLPRRATRPAFRRALRLQRLVPGAAAAAADLALRALGRAAARRSRVRLVPRTGPPALRAGARLATDDLEAHGPRGRAVAGRVGGAHRACDTSPASGCAP